MSIEKISSFAIGDSNLNAIMNTLNRAYKGQAQVTLSNYDNDSAPVVKVGSVFDCNGTQYAVSGSDETPTGYSGISNSTTFFLYFDESATAFVYDSTSPTWSDDLQGWYNGNDRALFSMYKDSGGTLYQHKNIITNDRIRTKRISIGSWDMDADTLNYMDGGEIGINDPDDIIGIKVIILADDVSSANYSVPLDMSPDGSAVAGRYNINTTYSPFRLYLTRFGGGFFDNTSYDDTSINRGYVYIMYTGDSP